jgi:hypothetical protein
MDASVSVKAAETAELDEQQHSGRRFVGLLLSPWQTERLVSLTPDECSSSFASTSPA